MLKALKANLPPPITYEKLINYTNHEVENIIEKYDLPKQVPRDRSSAESRNIPLLFVEGKIEARLEEKTIPDHCVGCKSLNPKDNKCHYGGDASDDFDVDINEETGKGECYEESFFNQAKKLFDEGLWMEAIDLFKKSKEISVKNEWADEVLQAEKFL